MSAHRSPTGSTDEKTTDTPTVYEIAARIDVDAQLLERFVDDHPDPTAAIVLGWAMADPDEHHEAVVAWLDDHGRTVDREPIEIDDDAPTPWKKSAGYTEGAE